MADATTPTPSDSTDYPYERRFADDSIVFHGSPRNMAVGFTMLFAGIMAFVMGFTDVFFAEAMAWVFIIWGALFLIGDLLDYVKTWRVTESALVVSAPARFAPRKVWDWEHIYRLDVIVKRIDPKVEDVEMQVYFTPQGDSVLEREDRIYSEELVQLIVDRAKLKPTSPHNPTSFTTLLPDKAVYIWNRSGKSIAA